MDQDFLVFQLKLLSSITPSASLEDNLRIIMAPALGKLQQACGANVALHVFVNPEVREAHAMVVGTREATCQALGREMELRHNPPEGGRPPVCADLPSYVRLDWTSTGETQRLFTRDENEYQRSLTAGDRLLRLLQRLADAHPEEFTPDKPMPGDVVIVIPIGTRRFSRLGYVVLWAPGPALASVAADVEMVETRVGFRTSLEHLLVRVFTNFYQMTPQTYLPSFCRPATKPVTLLCAEIWRFGDLVRLLNGRHELASEKRDRCLRSLITRFTTTAAGIVEHRQGRVDQIWGSGLLAVFGEYLDTPDFSARPGCKRALAAAREIVTGFRDELRTWLRDDFRLSDYRRLNSEEVKVAPVVALDHGEVVFDYVGSRRHRRYMAVGDHVLLVKELASMVGGSGLDAAVPCLPPSSVRLALEPGTLAGPPIVLTQSARELATDALFDRQGCQVGEVSLGRVIRIPVLDRECVVYPICPENIRSEASGS